MFEYIKSDLSRLVEPTITNFIKYYFFPQGTMFRFQVWFRIMQFVKLNRLLRIFLGPFIYIIYRHYEYKYGIHINSNIPVGKGLCLIHGDGVFLNVRSIGENVTIAQNVTCGVWGGVPTIGNNVTIYVGAVILGEVLLDDGCVVGAMSLVRQNVEKNTTVAGIPAKIINRNV